MIARHQGHLVKLIGDGVLAEFGSTDVAVRAALALQAGFNSRASTLPVPARLCIGVHMGDVVTAPERDIYGEGVNTAVHLQSQAPPGGVAVSEDVWRQLRQRPEFHFEALGQCPLEGADGPVRVYSVALRAEAEERGARVAAGGGRLRGFPRSCARPIAGGSLLRRWFAIGTGALIAVMSGAARDSWL